MTTEVTQVEEVDTDNVDTASDPSTEVETSNELEAVKARLAEVEAEAARQRSIKKKVVKERDEWKQKASATNTNTDDNDVKYKDLFEQERAKNEAITKQRQDTVMTSTLTERLSKAGVKPDALAAAVKLADRDIIEFDEDGSIDGVSVDAAVLKLRGSDSFLFEDKVKPTSTRQPATKTSASNEITRAEFDALSPVEKSEKMKAGVKIVD